MSEFDCQKCGACCTHFHKSELQENGIALWGVPINPTFHSVPARLIQIGKPLTVADGKEEAENGQFYTTDRFMAIDGVKCAALTGKVGTLTACQIYEHRPPVCRAFTAGSDKCLDARTAEGVNAE